MSTYEQFISFVFIVSGKKSTPKPQTPQRYRPQVDLSRGQQDSTSSPEENVPSYMKSTSASAKKERPVSAASVNLLATPRRRTSIGQTQSQLDLRTVSDEDSSSEENGLLRSKNRRRSSSHDRRYEYNIITDSLSSRQVNNLFHLL